MAKKDAALRVLEWELAGHGDAVLRAMLAHPDMSLADAVSMISKENPSLGEPSGTSERKGELEEAPEPPTRRRRTGPELASLQQEFATFRHLLGPKEAKEVDEAIKALVAQPDPDGLAALRRRVRTLALQAAFWRDLAAPKREPNALGILLFKADGARVSGSGSMEYLEEDRMAEAVRSEVARQGPGLYVMHLTVGRLVIARGKTAALATLFRHAPGKEAISVLERTVGAIDDNGKAAERTFGNPALAERYAEALLRLVQRVAG